MTRNMVQSARYWVKSAIMKDIRKKIAAVIMAISFDVKNKRLSLEISIDVFEFTSWVVVYAMSSGGIETPQHHKKSL